MSQDGAVRLQYFEGQFLRKQDFTDEQDYHLAMRRRHNLGQHGWGIVRGLEPAVKEKTLCVTPGMAIDGYGRELILTTPLALPHSAFRDQRSDALDVWLLYDRQSSDPAPLGWASVGDDEERPSYRWREEPRLRLLVPDRASPEARRPPGVPEKDLDFGPHRMPPDDPLQEWPVYLGRIRHQPDDEDEPFLIDPRGRPYAAVVGEQILSPWDDGTRVELGAEAPGERDRFAVYLPSAEASGEPEPRLEIAADGEVGIRGRTTVGGGLNVAGGAVDFHAGGARAPEEVPTAHPWQVYLRELESGERELRIEIEGAGDGTNRAVIGTFSEEEGAFQPILSVADNQTVTVHGDLVVEGLLIRGKRRPEPNVSPEAEAYLLSGYLSGLNQGEDEEPAGLDDLLTAPLETVAEWLGESSERLEDFASLLEEGYPELRRRLAEFFGGTPEG
ncbi:MAG: hypothetical protein GY856_22175 [bacterium]|nr:hypothetical protein [bacterium]